ncbi:MAG: hypothetical protein J2P57_21660 [Acidimicrobiaceae bacterium]|nr:hypothetical protein [Acidimicrobiaceae bacterium]
MVHRVVRSVTAVAAAAGLSVGLASTASADPGHVRNASLTARVLINGARLHHNVKGKAEALSDPDDIARVRGRLFVAWQNGVGSMGEPSSTGNTASTLVEASLSGRVLRQWDLTGKIDGLGANQQTGEVVATVNEDGNSSLYTINPEARNGGVTHYRYNQQPLPHGGGTDAVTFQDGLLLISASAPTVANGPAVYEVRLEPTGTAVVKSLFADNAAARPANPGAPTKLALTDPDSNISVPRSAPRFGGDFMLDSQGDMEQIYVSHPGTPAQTLSVLALSRSVDDTAFVTNDQGVLVSSDPTSDTVDTVSGPFHAGQAFVAVTPCDANGAPSTCPAPGFPANHLGSLDLRTGKVSPVKVTGATFNPQSLLFAAAGQGSQGQQGQQGQGGQGGQGD